MPRHASSLALALLLPACGTSTPAEDPHTLRPGKWEMTTTLESIRSTTLSPAQVQAMRDAFPKPVVDSQCITGKTPLVGSRTDDGCTFTRVADAGAVISRTSSCPRPGQPVPAIAEATGRRSATSYEIDTTVAQPGPSGGPSQLEIVTRETGKWLGPCDARH